MDVRHLAHERRAAVLGERQLNRLTIGEFGNTLRNPRVFAAIEPGDPEAEVV